MSKPTSKFICQRLNLLLSHIAETFPVHSTELVIRLLVPFLTKAFETASETNSRLAILAGSKVTQLLFSRVVTEPVIADTLNKELFFKNLDSALLLMQALKREFADLKPRDVYDVMVNMVP